MPRSSSRRSAASATTRCSPARCRATSRTSPAPDACSPIRQAFYPAFATHNAHTLAAVAEIAVSAGGSDEWEYQRLHGMGEELYDQVVGEDQWGRACRVYAPVGSHEDLLAYLVRRLLENGANSSFVNRIADASLPIDALIADPVEKAAALAVKRQDAHPAAARPLRRRARQQ
jgi:RHH-type proline utilization regulon transcriptional repressor/proline dehydrogenase/delta 1-pyrroline-5-carboxylate dehydrogenase